MITVATELFKKAVTKADKACGKNALLPITQMVGIKVKSNKLHICATDGTNDFQYIIDKVKSEDVSITVKVEPLAKLMAKVTSDSVTLDIQDNLLVIKANGDYKIPLEVDEEGVVDFPDIKFSKVGKKAHEVNLTTITNILNINKPALSVKFDNPFLTGYHIGEKILSTDNETICCNDITFADVTKETPILVRPEMMYLISLNETEKVKFVVDGKTLYFYTPEMVVCGPQLDGIEDYPVDEISEFLDSPFPSMCKIPKSLLMGVIDRLQIFIEPYDENGATFTFTQDGLTISSIRSSSVETINYSESKEFAPFVCKVFIPMFKEQLAANPADIIELHYGLEEAIKLTNGKVSQVMSLMGDATQEE